MFTAHAQIMQISIAYSTRIQLLFNDKVMYETSLIMEGRFQCIFGTVLFVTRRETAVIVVFVDRPEAYETIDRPFCKFRVACVAPCLFHKVKGFAECIGRIVRCGIESMRHVLPRYDSVM